MGNASVHVPVLLKEVLSVLALRPGAVVIDATLGGGGHSRAMLQAIGPKGFLLALDADPVAADKYNAQAGANTKAVVANFSRLDEVAQLANLKPVDAILFDFGLSSDQLDDPARGFSFQQAGPLDMRLDQQAEKPTAADYVNRATLDELAQIIKAYGEEFNARRIARAITNQRKARPIATTAELFEIIKRTLPPGQRAKAGDVARRTFQALRIKVNNELEIISQGLRAGYHILGPGGRMVAISFHSLEDRIVKNYFLELARACTCPPQFPVCVCGGQAKAKNLTPKPILASLDEQKNNPRSQSAKLRAIEKIK
jgi:16S rRNA (cytosine1402-N4)-methyltransferase